MIKAFIHCRNASGEQAGCKIVLKLNCMVFLKLCFSIFWWKWHCYRIFPFLFSEAAPQWVTGSLITESRDYSCTMGVWPSHLLCCRQHSSGNSQACEVRRGGRSSIWLSLAKLQDPCSWQTLHLFLEFWCVSTSWHYGLPILSTADTR